MKELDNRVHAAFDSVHADEDLKASARAYVRQEVEKRRRPAPLRRLQPLAAMACMLLVFFGGYFSRMYFEPVSVISIDINPSIELGVNTFDHVVCVEAFNEDGRELAEDLQLRFLNYEKAVERIVSSDTVTTLLDQEEELVIAVVSDDEMRNQQFCSRLESYMSTGKGGHCYSAQPETVEAAHGCGLSYGKYLAYQEALKQDETLTAEDIQDMTMKEIRELTEETCETQTHQTQRQSHSHKHKKGHH